MSSTDHPFVQAFARTRRNSDTKDPQSAPARVTDTRQSGGNQLPSEQQTQVTPETLRPQVMPPANVMPPNTQSTGPAAPAQSSEPVARVNTAVADRADDPVHIGMRLDASIAETAQLWLEPVQNQYLRIDTPKPENDSPGVEPMATPDGELLKEVDSHREIRSGEVAADPLTEAPTLRHGTPVSDADVAEVVQADSPTMETIAPLQNQVFTFGDFAETAIADVGASAPFHEPSQDPFLRVDSPHIPIAPPRNSIVQKSGDAQSHEAHAIDGPEPPEESLTDDARPTSDDELGDPQRNETTAVVESPNESLVGAVWPGAQWEVDVFDVPQSVASLFFDDDFFRSIAKRMRETVQEGLQSLAVTSLRSGEGRSTVAIGTAIAAAATGLRVALVDCDVHAPTLVDELRLELDHGWGDAIRSGVALNQIAVSSIEDGVTLFPLMPHSELVDPAEIVALMRSLVGQFDLVVVDAPLGADTILNTVCQTVDSAVIARDVRFTSQAEVNQLAEKLRSAGVIGVGVVENFVG